MRLKTASASQNHTVDACATLAAECDSLIKSGQVSAVASRISALTFSKVPRASRQALAKICRRAGLVNEGLRLLHPIIREETISTPAPTPGEICEYAFLLSRNGSTQEALDLLRGVDARTTPIALLYLASCEIEKWNYQAAAELLERFLDAPADAYSKLIARVNLGAAYLAIGKFDEVESFLTKTIQIAEGQGAFRLVGNTLEQRAQFFFQMNDFSRSRRDLERASEIFGQNGTYDQLLILKWQSIIEAVERNSTRPLELLRARATEQKHWETVREADLFSLRIKFDQRAFDHLYFGTPMPSYRARIEQQISHEPSSHYSLGSRNPRHVLDLETGVLYGSDGELNSGKKIHQMLLALVQDFYVPRNMGSLFAEIYPDEYFNIESSPLKIRQILHRTREWLESSGLPASIDFAQGRYRLIVDGPFALRLARVRDDLDGNLARWVELKNLFSQSRSFTAHEARERLGVSRASLHRLTQWAVKKGLLLKMGNGPATSYEIRDEGEAPTIGKERLIA